jgi:hypothetical protein
MKIIKACEKQDTVIYQNKQITRIYLKVLVFVEGRSQGYRKVRDDVFSKSLCNCKECVKRELIHYYPEQTS